MHTQLREIHKRLDTDMDVQGFLILLNKVADEIGWSDDTLFDVMLEYNDDRREEYEADRKSWGEILTEGKWANLHQCVVMNQWIKGMNLKVACVKRNRFFSITLKSESFRIELGDVLLRIVDGEVGAQTIREKTETCSQDFEERERLFGAMLLSERVANKVRSPFLNGEFSEALRVGYEVYASRLEELLGMTLKPWKDMETIFFQERPCFLFPDLSGDRLKLELAALARLSSGLELLLQPFLRGFEKAPEDPAIILKILVLISLLVDRLDAATSNPSSIYKKNIKKTVKKNKTRKRSLKAKKIVQKNKKTLKTRISS